MAQRDANYFAEILYGVLQEVPKEKVALAIQNFLAWLERQGRRSLFPKLTAAYQEVAARMEGVPKVEIWTARKIPELEKLLKQALKNKDAIVETKIDPKMLGGAVIQIDDQRLDGSLSGRINDLKKVLSYGHY